MAESPSPQPLDRLRLALRDARARLEASDRARHEPIAVVGLGGRLPGASSIEDFWPVLRDGRDLVGEMPVSRGALTGDRWREVPAHLRVAGWLDDIDAFDHQLFGVSPDEATALDPQQRLLLEATWAALEDAGVNPLALRGRRAGVWVGISNSDYAQRTVRAGDARADAYGLTGAGLSLAPGRIAYLLGLRGPALAIDTACSSSLVALHLAVESLRRGECDWAIVGGVQVILEPDIAIGLDRMAALSPRGRCRTFDAGADGFVRGEGALVAVLRRVSDAERDADPIRALVLGSAVNQDGASSGLTAPNGLAQREVIRAAMDAARVTPAEVQVVEAHGTGTALGDPIELEALADVFGGRETPLRVGSVKTNVGHLEAAAGLAGLVKLALAFEHETLPPHLHVQTPTPHVDWTRMPLAVPVTPEPWRRDEFTRRIAGLSSFGFSGTNAHIIVAEPPRVPDAEGDEGWPHLVPISARTPQALEMVTRQWAHAVHDVPIAAVARTAMYGRASLSHRRAVIASSSDELAAALAAGSHVEGVAAGDGAVDVIVEFDGVTPAPAAIADLRAHVPAFSDAWDEVPAEVRSRSDRWTWVWAMATWLRASGIEPVGCVMRGVDEGEALASALDLAWSPQPAVDTTVTLSLSPSPDAGDAAAVWRGVLAGVARVFVAGVAVRWDALLPRAGRRVRLPGYPFERHRFWVTTPAQAGVALAAPVANEGRRFTREEILDRLQSMLAQAGAADDGPIPVDANLFTLGIDSIMLIQVRGLVVREFGVELDLAKFYDETSTLERLAAWIDAHQTAVSRAAAPAIAASSAPAPATPAAPARSTLPNRPGRAASAEVAAAQRVYLERFAPDYVAKTAGSRDHVARHRPHLATSRNLAGFRADWKEIVYQIVGGEGRGARLVDVDGREYVDFTMGFGAALLGHNPDVVREALSRQLARGFALGPLSDLAGDAAAAVTRLTGVDRVAFFNTGSEAVMNAVRIARTVTQRSRLVLFDGSYHGTFDGVLALDLDGESVPISPGTTRGMVEDVIVLRYGDPASLEAIAREAGSLAGVLVEPVQSRHPDLQPEWFLRDLRALTAAHDVPLILDEMITGFRSHPGGVQRRWGIEADIVTYGKVLGGGLPIGAVAGRRRFLDAVDGGVWQYGDASLPTAATTFSSGTFCNHPLSMAAALAVLSSLEREGPALQRAVDQRTARLCEQLNAACAAEGFPLRMVWFSSLFRFVFEADLELLFFHLLARGFYVWEGRNCFLSTAHTDDDCDRFVEAVIDSLRVMRAGGLFATRPQPQRVTSIAAAETVEHPAAPAQRRIALVQEAGDAEAAYHLHDARLYEGPLDLARLQRAFDTVVTRHDSLRTGFRWHDGELRQVVHTAVSASLERVDRMGENPAAVARSLLRPFDLARPPLIRLTVARLAPERWLLLCDVHHLVCDGASFAVLIEELLRAYGGEVLPPVQQYPVFAAQHLARLSGADGARLAAYWRQVFPAPPPLLTLPTDEPRPLSVDTAGATLRAEVPAPIVQGLRATARASGATLYAVLLSAYHTWLARLASADDVVIGVPIAGRPGPGFDRTIGMFVATVPIRLAYMPTEPVTAVVTRVARTLLSAVEHGDYPLEHLVESLGGTRHPGRQPLFDTMFEFETGPAGEPQLDGIELQPVPLDDGTAMFDLDIELRQAGDRLWLAFKYRTSLWRPETAADWCDSFLAMLAAFAAEPAAPCGRLPLVSPARRHALIADVNDTTVTYPALAVHEVIARQSAMAPERVALTAPDGAWRYDELWGSANQIAVRLQEAGAGPEQAVAIVLRRSPVAVASALAAWQTGAYYAPLDPAAPAGRLREIIHRLRPAVLLIEADLAASVTGPEGTVVLPVDGAGMWLAGVPASSMGARPVHPEQAAYVLFTSGSTGVPKGVVVSHRALSNHIAWYVRCFAVSEDDVFVQKTVCTFDTSITELYAALTTGARLVLPAPDAHQDPAAMARLIRDERVTMLEDVPSFADLLVAEPALGALTTLRWHNPGGEALTSSLARRCAAATGARVANLYGPTEAAVDALYEVWDGTERGGWVPIGRPVDNTSAYILDANLEPVPAGVPGDLYVGGVQLARGYLGQRGLTADRFVPDPFGPPGSRLYRTGDRAWRLADGRVVYAGRADQQIKLRGVRIEPGEIETALRECPGVTDAVAGTWPAPDGTPMLVAWVQPAAPADWRARLRRRLPASLVPSHVVPVNAWPVLPNGKLDRQALPAPSFDLPRETTHDEPKTPGEARVAAVFRDVLGVPALGRDDDFFLLGGHSLLAARAIARVRVLLGRDVPLRLLFEQPTVAGFAAALDDQAPSASGLEIAPQAETYPLTGAQRGVWLACRQRGDDAGYVMAEAYVFDGPFDAAAFVAAVSMVMARHEALRMRVVVVDGEPRQQVMPAGDAAIDVIDVSSDPSAHSAALARAQAVAARPFDLERGPLLRGVVCRLATDRHLVALAIHHLVFDAWSSALFAADVRDAYGRARRGDHTPLPELTHQFKDVAMREARRREAGAEAAARHFWRTTLADVARRPDLPLDRPRPAHSSTTGDEARAIFDASLVARLDGWVSRAGTTRLAGLLTAVHLLLHARTGVTDSVVGTVAAGRTEAAVESLIGFFVNTLAQRARIDRAQSIAQLLDAVRASLTGAVAHQDYPFERVVSDLAPQREPGRHALFDVVVNMLDQGMAEAGLADGAWPDARVTRVDLPLTDAKFDLMFVCAPARQDGGDGLEVTLEYRTDLFDPESAARWLDDLRAVVSWMVEQPSATVATFVREWHRRPSALAPLVWQGATPPLPEGGLWATFLRIARDHADSIAIEAGDRRLTYRELCERATVLGDHLAQAGIGPGARVGVPGERGVDAIVSILAVIARGAVYVPLDPALPDARLRWMVADAGLAAIIAAEGDIQLHAGQVAAQVPAHVFDPAWPAYVMYTSGSTGTPKGIVVPQRAVMRLAYGVAGAPLRPGVRVALASSLAFDASTFELWGALLHGGTLVVIPRDVLLDPVALSAQLAAAPVDVLWLTAGVFHALVRVAPQALHQVPCVMAGGDAVQVDAVRALIESGYSGRVLNGYGPTENTTFTTTCDASDLGDAAVRVPIGRPIAHTEVYVVDAQGRPCAVGEPGELWTGGLGLALGYLGRPSLTAERFVPHPFSSTPGARLYRTGDRVRWNAEGTLDFLGRIDRQVKVRGFRVEPGEVEEALRRLPGIRAAVVDARPAPGGDRRLLAWVEETAAGAAAGARAALGNVLPAALVPSAVIPIGVWPLTVNGKIAIDALPNPEAIVAAESGDTRAADGGKTTLTILRDVWRDVLRREAIEAADNFFALGGDSIQAIQVVSRAAERGVTLRMPLLFEYQTLGALADAVDRDTITQTGGASAAGPIEATPIQRWFLRERHPAPESVTQSVRLIVRGPVALMQPALDAVVAHHDAFRLRVEADGRLSLADAAQPVVIRSSDDAPAPLDPTTGLVASAQWIAGEAQGAVSVRLVLHHLIVDGVSWRILVADLETAIRQLAAGGPVRLPAVPTGLQAVGRWSVDAARRVAEDRAQTGYWTSVAQVPATITLDDPSAPNLVGGETRVEATLDSETTRRLQSSLQAAGLTMEAALVGTVASVCAPSGTEFRLDVEGHGRADDGPDLSRTVGWLTALYPVGIRRPAASDPGAWIRAAADGLRRTPGQGIGYGLLREIARVPALVDAQPSAIVVNYHGDVGYESELFALASTTDGPPEDPRAPRRHEVEVTAELRAAGLCLVWTAAASRISPDRLAAWSARVMEALRWQTVGVTPAAAADSLVFDDLVSPE